MFSKHHISNDYTKMRDISAAILSLIDTSKNTISTLNVDKIIFHANDILHHIIDLDSSFIRLKDRQNSRLLSLEACSNIPKSLADKMKYVRIGSGIEGMAAKNRTHIILNNLKNETKIKFVKELARNDIQSILCVPIIFDSEVYGTITIASTNKNKYGEKDVFLLFSFAMIVAIALKNAYLYKNLKDSYLSTINSLVLIMESRDPYMRGHSERVTDIAVDIARHMKLPESDLHILRTAGKLHDIGKITISDSILTKTERLTPSDWAEIHLHTIRGVEIIMPLKFLGPGISLIRNHHEKYDGNGYPDGLSGDSIPLLARVVTVADAFDAMTSKRPYRKPLSCKGAVGELRANSGTQFDPEIVEVFTDLMNKER